MKTYTFAPISAREYPTLKILDNPYIWGGVQFCVNVSEKPYTPELEAAMAAHGIEWVHCPVSEDPGADWLPSFAEALPRLYLAFREGKKMIVHCDLGNNRSRSLVEALHFAVKHVHFPDEYKGEFNHLIYNCKEGHLPSIQELEHRITRMLGIFPNWSLLTEDQMREKLLTPTSQIPGRRPRRKCVSDGSDFGDIEICGTPDLNHYYETGELPKDETNRKFFLLLKEKGLI